MIRLCAYFRNVIQSPLSAKMIFMPYQMISLIMYLFDNVLVVGGEKMDNMRLLSTYRVGKKRMFLYRDVSDKRIQGYHETKINKDNLYYKAFDYSLLPSYFFEKLKKECEDSGARLVLDDERYPLIVEKNGHNYGWC